MITVCKNCGAALDETRETCPDCGMPNPWYQDRAPAGGPAGFLFDLFDRNAKVARILLVLAGIDLAIGLISLMSLMVTPWSALPVQTRVVMVASLAFGVGNLKLALHADSDVRTVRLVARGVGIANAFGMLLMFALGRARAL